MRFVVGFLLGVIACVGAPLLGIRLGYLSMAARPEPGAVEEFVGELAYEWWIEGAAPKQSTAFAGDPAAIAVGLDHFRENCVACHGGPDVAAAELAKGLHPAAPELSADDVQKMSDGELFWTTREGVRLTGMPAFGPTHSDEEIWKIVAFVRRLPHLTPEEKEKLRATTQEEHGHHHHDEEAPSTGDATPRNERHD